MGRLPSMGVPMKCPHCGAALEDNATKCSACGKEVGLGTRMAEESIHVGKEVGAGAEKVGKGIWGGVKKVGAATKKELSHDKDEKAQ